MHPEFLASLVAQRRAQLQRDAEEARLRAQAGEAPASATRAARTRRADRRRWRAANRLRRRAGDPPGMACGIAHGRL